MVIWSITVYHSHKQIQHALPRLNPWWIFLKTMANIYVLAFYHVHEFYNVQWRWNTQWAGARVDHWDEKYKVFPHWIVQIGPQISRQKSNGSCQMILCCMDPNTRSNETFFYTWLNSIIIWIYLALNWWPHHSKERGRQSPCTFVQGKLGFFKLSYTIIGNFHQNYEGMQRAGQWNFPNYSGPSYILISSLD